ncbi:MAG: isoprenylcysteine carboxylmethyltransferase family protein [Bacilli bacterium]|nr:isoprenylcysteine carboxylmethyltransferase family protein [Bacilli bacterium]
MDKKLFFPAISKFFLGFLIVGCLLFLPANSFSYWNAWLMIGLLFIPMFLGGLLLLFKDPDLLRRRLQAKEKEKEQQIIVILSGFMFLAGFLVAGFNYRFQWLKLSNTVVIIASILFMIAYALYAEVLRENSFLSRTIGVDENQKVVDTGLYGIVRHPMYLVTILLFLTMPLILGSIQSFFIFLLYPIIIVRRIQNEETVLAKELKGYSKYQEKVRYKLIPFIW